MNEKDSKKSVPVFYTSDCMKLAKKLYWWIPRMILARAFHAEDVYMTKIGIMDSPCEVDEWLGK